MLVLTQSKTAWAAGVVILLVVWCPLALRRAFNAASAVQQFNRAVWSTVGVIALLILSGGALVAFDVIDKLLSKTDLMTLTGRTEIWTITLEAWKDNPLFGFGPGVWGAERQQRFQMFHVGHAHNQIVQSLGEAGLVGLLFLCSYLGVLLYAAMRRFEVSRGVVLTLLMLVAVRCVTEAPLSRSSLLSWDMFLHALLMVTACHHLRTRGQAVPHAHSQPYPTALAPQPCRATSPSARSRWFQADATPSFALSSYGFARRSSTERPAL